MGIRIRTGGLELEVDDEAALALLRERGMVGTDAERWIAGGWRPLVPEGGVSVKAASDPWDAWSEVDEQSAEAALHRAVKRPEEEVAELPLGSLTPMPQPIIVARPPNARPQAPVRATPNLAERAVAPAPEPPAPVAAPPAAPARVESPPLGVVPRPAPPTSVVHLPPPRIPAPSALPGPSAERTLPREAGVLFDFPERGRSRAPPVAVDEPVPLVRPGRLIAMILAGVAVLGGVWAGAELSRPSSDPIPAVSKPTRATAADDPLKETERRLRAVPLGDARPVSEPGHLEDAMTIELQKLGVRVVRVRSPVTRWTGRKDDDPAAAEVHVTFRSEGDLDAELGAIQLVVGRYKLAYTLDVPEVEAILEDDEGERATHLDADRAQRFAQGRIGLSEAVKPGA